MNFRGGSARGPSKRLYSTGQNAEALQSIADFLAEGNPSRTVIVTAYRDFYGVGPEEMAPLGPGNRTEAAIVFSDGAEGPRAPVGSYPAPQVRIRAGAQ